MAYLLQKKKYDRAFNVTITDADIGSVKSLHIDLDHMLVKFEQNRMVRNILRLKLFGKEWLPIFWESVDTIFGKQFCDINNVRC